MQIPPQDRPGRVALVSDFGSGGPYVGQIALSQSAWAQPIPYVALISDLAPFRPDLAGYLLPALKAGMPPDTLFVCVVDPGVGSARGVLALQRGPSWWVGPDNGLLVPLMRSLGDNARLWRIDWRPAQMSASFHARDLFLPLAAQVAVGVLPGATPLDPAGVVGTDLPQQREAVCYVDHYGNLITGVRAADVPADTLVVAAGRRIVHARTFSSVGFGQAFWYENAFGLVEIAVNQGRADEQLGMLPGDSIALECEPDESPVRQR